MPGMTLQTLQHTISVVLNYATIGIGIYLCVRWHRKRKGQNLTEMPSSARLNKRLAPAISKTIVYLTRLRLRPPSDIVAYE